MFSSTMTWLDDASSMSILLLTTSLSAVAAYIIYMRFWHPLAHCPGPFIASLTNLWSAKMSVDGDWPHRMDTLHAQYGPVVRIAPNEVCIDEPEAIPAIYGLATGFIKTSFYPPFGNPQHKPNPFNAVNDGYHSQLKRWYGPAFTMKTMLGLEEVMRKGVTSLLKNLDLSSDGQTVVNLGFKLESLAFDLSSLVSCGEAFANIVAAHVGRFPLSQFLLSKMAAPAAITKGFAFTAEFLERQLQRHEADADSHSDQMSVLMKAYEGKTDEAYPDLSPYRDRVKQAAQVALAAGSETTGTTMTALFYWLLRTPTVLGKLMEEIDSRAASFAEDGTISASEAAEMPYLLATVKEALRIHPAVSYPLPRIVPPGGVHLAGRYFEAGTQVGVSAWQIHQHEEIFGEKCREFRPDRWLTKDREVSSRMDKYMFSFGGGSRTCIGKNLSLLEMRLAVPAILHAFTIEPVNPSIPLEYKNHWFALANKLDVRLQRRA